MTRFVNWLALNGAMGALLWFGIVQGVAGAGNVFVACTWIALLLSGAALSDGNQATLRRVGRPTWHRRLSVLYDVATAVILFWHGWWFTGFAYAVASLLQEAAWQAATEPQTA